MNIDDKQKISDLIMQVSNIPENQRNEQQKIFIDQIINKKLDWRIMSKSMKDDSLYDGVSISQWAFDATEQEFIDFLCKSDLDIMPEGNDLSKNKNPVNGINFKGEEGKKSFYRVQLDESNFNIKIKLQIPEESIPNEVFKFIKDISNVRETLKDLYKKDQGELLEKIHSLAGIARVGSSPMLSSFATTYLRQFKESVVRRKGFEIKIEYIKTLGILSLFFVFLFSGLYFSVEYFRIESLNCPIFLHGLFVLTGASVGVWLSFAIRRRNITFLDLRDLIHDKKSPFVLLLVVLIVTLIFYVMFITGLLNIEIGDSFNTKTFSDANIKEEFAFLIGVFFGLSERTIGPKLTSRVDSFFSNV